MIKKIDGKELSIWSRAKFKLGSSAHVYLNLTVHLNHLATKARLFTRIFVKYRKGTVEKRSNCCRRQVICCGLSGAAAAAEEPQEKSRVVYCFLLRRPQVPHQLPYQSESRRNRSAFTSSL